MAKYTLTNKAVEDLSHIWNYTCEAWSEKQADKYYRLIIVAFGEMAAKPTLGKSYKEISTEIFGFRTGKHIIFFRILKRNEVLIVRILHENMDLRSRMED